MYEAIETFIAVGNGRSYMRGDEISDSEHGVLPLQDKIKFRRKFEYTASGAAPEGYPPEGVFGIDVGSEPSKFVSEDTPATNSFEDFGGGDGGGAGASDSWDSGSSDSGSSDSGSSDAGGGDSGGGDGD